ncbi:hypothetical protein DL93DRAFT_2124058 [Clavulina sp. PMI_390]|nr:hypothetical protein DL93DRAFT_2124058 [Clavulina sp. PMI_390]
MEHPLARRANFRRSTASVNQLGDEEDDLDSHISRYDDFTTIDWIHDSILDRNRRLRRQDEIENTLKRAHGAITWSWIWAQIRRMAGNGQSCAFLSRAASLHSNQTSIFSTGAFIGVNAAFISILTEWLSDLRRGYCSEGWWLNQEFCCWEIEDLDSEGACAAWIPWSSFTVGNWIVYVVLACLFAWLSAHLVQSFARYAAGSGISEIKCILAGFVMKGYLGGWTLLIKSLTLPFIIASGLNVGKEGPSVHVACCTGFVVASLFSRFTQSQGKMREILTAASAAGVAVAFGSPIGGVLFSIEEMSPTFSIKTMWRSFLCALVATVTLSAMNPFRTGKLVLFQVTYDRDWHFFEIIFFVIIGVFGGLYGAFVVKFNLQVAAFRRKHLAAYPISEAMILASLTAAFSFFNKFLRIDMTESLAILFRECEGGGDYDNLCQTWAQWRMANSLLLATIFRTGFVIISYGSRVPAGIFVPSMAVGATFGRMVGIIVKAMYRAYPTVGLFAVCKPDVPCITPGTYALLGAAAALGGVMRMTLTVVVIMFELTGALTYILPTMIVLLVTRFVGDYFENKGIADEMIKFNGYPFLHANEQAYNVPVSRAMRTNVIALRSEGMTVKEVEIKLGEADVQGYPVVSVTSNLLVGYIGKSEVRYVIEKYRRIGSITDETRCVFFSGANHHHAAPENGSLPTPYTDASPTVPNTARSTLIGVTDEDIELLEAEPSEELSFESYVNQTPMIVAPRLPLEIVMQMFKKLGPRVILVEQFGQLRGLLTVKDVMRFLHELESTAGPTTNEFIPLEVWDEYQGTLRNVLERSWEYASARVDALLSWARRVLPARTL